MVEFRDIRKKDRESVKQVLKATRHFTDYEIAVALELVDEVLNKEDLSYLFVVAEQDGKFAGYGCWGPVPITMGTYDIYWIAALGGVHNYIAVSQSLTSHTLWTRVNGIHG